MIACLASASRDLAPIGAAQSRAASDLPAFRCGFPVANAHEDFDFQPRLGVKRVKALAGCGFIGKKENVILIGQPSTGKTHPAIGRGK